MAAVEKVVLSPKEGGTSSVDAVDRRTVAGTTGGVLGQAPVVAHGDLGRGRVKLMEVLGLDSDGVAAIVLVVALGFLMVVMVQLEALGLGMEEMMADSMVVLVLRLTRVLVQLHTRVLNPNPGPVVYPMLIITMWHKT